MLATQKFMLVLLTVGTVLVGTAADAAAQCNSGGGAGGVTSSARGAPLLMYPPIVRLAPYGMIPQYYPGGQALAMQRQMYQQAQQRMLASRRSSASRYQSAIDQDVLAMRRERAEEKRRKRAERIARAKEKREAERSGNKLDGDLPSLYASKSPATESPATTLIAQAAKIDPFAW